VQYFVIDFGGLGVGSVGLIGEHPGKGVAPTLAAGVVGKDQARNTQEPRQLVGRQLGAPAPGRQEGLSLRRCPVPTRRLSAVARTHTPDADGGSNSRRSVPVTAT
jgi:hypothetical protein